MTSLSSASESPTPARRPHEHPPPDTSKVFTEQPHPNLRRRPWLLRRFESLGWDTGVAGLERKEQVGLLLFLCLASAAGGLYAWRGMHQSRAAVSS